MKRHVPSLLSRQKIKRILQALLLVLLLLSSALFTYGPKHNAHIPSWDAVYRRAGLAGGTGAAYKFPVTVSFLDVGQGDSCLIHCRTTGYTMLIDTGPEGNEDVILQELKRVGADTIQDLVITHPHADHIGSLPELLESVSIGTVWMPAVEDAVLDDPSLYHLVLNRLGAKGTDFRVPVPGQTQTVGALSFSWLGPLQPSENLNNDSLVLRMTYGTLYFLFAGDAEEEEEQDLLQSGQLLKADILKVGHHGSSSSSTVSFISAVQPSAAVISCGLNNDYGHPSQATLQTLKAAGADLFRTDRNGTVVIGTDGKTKMIETEKENSSFYLMNKSLCAILFWQIARRTFASRVQTG